MVYVLLSKWRKNGIKLTFQLYWHIGNSGQSNVKGRTTLLHNLEIRNLILMMYVMVGRWVIHALQHIWGGQGEIGRTSYFLPPYGSVALKLSGLANIFTC